MIEKIAAAVITCDRPDFAEKCIKSLPECELYVINDGKQPVMVNRKHRFSQLGPYSGVVNAKYIAVEQFLQSDCDHLFIIEDDILCLREDVFTKYIETAQEFKLDHLMFGYHGPANKKNGSYSEPNPRVIIEGRNNKLALNQHCVGAFCYYSRKCIEAVGNFDRKFGSAFDHVSHSYSIAKAGLTTPYWWWADAWDSNEYLKEQACSEESSAIRGKPGWAENIQRSALYFEQVHGFLPAWDRAVPDVGIDNVVKFLKSKHD